MIMKEIPRYGLGKGGIRKGRAKIGMTKEWSIQPMVRASVLQTRVFHRASQNGYVQVPYTITFNCTYTLVSAKSLNQTWCNQTSLRLTIFP